jgi:hypothetical protein
VDGHRESPGIVTVFRHEQPLPFIKRQRHGIDHEFRGSQFHEEPGFRLEGLQRLVREIAQSARKPIPPVR